MSMDTDISVQDVDTINKLMTEMFNEEPSAADLAAVVTEITKLDGGLESFIENEQARAEKLKEWMEAGRMGRAPTPLYSSTFDGVQANGLNESPAAEPFVAFEPDADNSSLAGVKVTGIEDIHDFFAVPHQPMVGEGVPALEEIDEQVTEFMSLSAGERSKQEKEFVQSMGMDLERLREVAGATSAWNEIREIKSMLEGIRGETARVQHRFENFIDLYVKDKIPK